MRGDYLHCIYSAKGMRTSFFIENFGSQQTIQMEINLLNTLGASSIKDEFISWIVPEISVLSSLVFECKI